MFGGAGYLQIVTNFPIALTISFPDIFSQFLSAFSFVNIDLVAMFNLGCVSPPNFYTKFQVATIFPLIILAVGFLATLPSGGLRFETFYGSMIALSFLM